MKPIYKIFFFCLVIFFLSVVAAKMSIDHTFKELECARTDKNADLYFKNDTVDV